MAILSGETELALGTIRIKLLFKVETIRFYGLDPSFVEVYKVCLKSSVNGVISERQSGACVRAYAWFFRDVRRIETQHGLHVTGSVNRLRPVERSQCEGSVTAQWRNVQT